MDDFWCSTLLCEADPSIGSCPCGDPVQGPTEVDKNSQVDMGLSDEDVRDLALAWNETMGAVEASILAQNKYTWWLMEGQQNANASPRMLARETCAAQLDHACATAGDERPPQLYGMNTTLAQAEQDVAYFLLARGSYAWLGWGTWGMTWPFNPEPAHGELPPQPHGVPRPALLDRDFGAPQEAGCRATGGGVFERRFSKASVRLDCNSFVATFVPNELN